MTFDTGCTAGSEPKLTSPLYDTFEEADLLSAIPIFGAWLTVHLLGLNPAPFSVPDFCVNPPTGDLPTAADWLKLAFPPLAAVTGTYTRIGNQIKAWKFYDLCQCSAPGGGTCSSIAVPWTSLTNLGDPGDQRNFGITVTALGTGRAVYGAEVYINDTTHINRLILWDSTTTTSLRQKNVSSLASGRQHILFDTPYNLSNGESVTLAFSHEGTQLYYSWGSNAAPASDSQVSYSAWKENSDYSFCPTGSRTYKGPMNPLVCSGGPPFPDTYPVTPPPDADLPTDYPEPPSPVTCSTDQDICDALQTISRKIDVVKLQVDLIQRQHVPFQYQLGTVHSGLTGTGEFSVSAILGLVVSVTDVPSTWGKTGDTPSRYIPALAALQEGDDQGFENWKLVHYLEETFFEAHATSTLIRYNVKPNVEITVTELLAVP